MPERLIHKKATYDYNSHSDYILKMAYEIESALIEAGAKPGEDYSILDIFKLSIDYVSNIPVGKWWQRIF